MTSKVNQLNLRYNLRQVKQTNNISVLTCGESSKPSTFDEEVVTSQMNQQHFSSNLLRVKGTSNNLVLICDK